MSNKSKHRYKVRKSINKIKHMPTPRFSEPALLINNWDELADAKLENERFKVIVEEGHYNGSIYENINGEWEFKEYLSTHTFYGEHTHQYFYSTELLRECGFNVQLKNWDGETIYSR